MKRARGAYPSIADQIPGRRIFFEPSTPNSSRRKGPVTGPDGGPIRTRPACGHAIVRGLRDGSPGRQGRWRCFDRFLRDFAAGFFEMLAMRPFIKKPMAELARMTSTPPIEPASRKSRLLNRSKQAG